MAASQNWCEGCRNSVERARERAAGDRGARCVGLAWLWALLLTRELGQPPCPFWSSLSNLSFLWPFGWVW